MKCLKEFWRIICLYYSPEKALFDGATLLIVYAILNSLIWHQSVDIQRMTLIYMYVFFYPMKIIDILIKPKFLYWSIRNQSLPNDWQVKNLQFDCKEMYSWDVEKINKLRKTDE